MTTTCTHNGLLGIAMIIFVGVRGGLLSRIIG